MSQREEPILTDYLQMVKNLQDEYESLPVGRPEWMMKDIIQNSWDARVDKNSASGWSFSLRLFKRKSEYVVVIEDEGTTGLTGTMKAAEAQTLLASGKDIPARERRVRFLGQAITWGRTQDAAGGRGQGKGVLLIANNLNTVNFESLSEDGYFAGALQRSVKGTNMIDDDADAQKYSEEFYPELGPKRSNGVRILLDHPDSTLVDAMLDGTIDEYILASWWPVLATKAKVVIGVLGNERELDVSTIYAARVKAYRSNSELLGKTLIQKPSSEARIIGHRVGKAAVAIADLTGLETPNDVVDSLGERALSVHFIRQGMVVARYTIQEHLQTIAYDIKPEVRDAVYAGFYGYVELDGIEANREAKELENPLHYGFKNGRSGRMGKSVETFLMDPVRDGLEKYGLLLEKSEAADEQERAVQSNVQSVINRLASRLGLNAAKPAGPKGTNRPGGAPRMPIQIVIDNPHNGVRLQQNASIEGLQARIKNRQSCGIKVGVEFILESPQAGPVTLWEGDAALAASEERQIAFPAMESGLFSEPGRYRVVARVVLQSAGNLEVLDPELLASKTQVKVGWYREDATSLYIAIDPPRKGLIELVEMPGYNYGTMVYEHDDRSPKVKYYSDAPAVKAAKADSTEAQHELLLEIGLRALSEYVVNVRVPLEKIMSPEDIKQAEAGENLIQATYFMLRGKVE
jgi:hypothetical protein